MNKDYNLNSIYILESIKDGSSTKKGTCFSISKSLVLTAKHNILDRDKYYCYLDKDCYSAGTKIELEVEYLDAEFDFVILKSKGYEFREYISIGKVPTSRNTAVKSCGYPISRIDFAPIDTKIDADYSSSQSNNYCFSINQVDSVTNYKGMSGSPIMYKQFLVGILLVQEGNSVLYGISTSKILEKFCLDSKDISIFSQDEIEYTPPKCPPSPFEVEISCKKSLPIIKGLNIGFDFYTWRIKNLIDLACDWIIDYTLTQKQINVLIESNRLRSLTMKAVKEFPFHDINAIIDLFLHISIRQNYKTIPIINKLFDIDGNSIFSSSHVIVNKGNIEVWLGVSSINITLEKAVNQAIFNIKTLITIQNIDERLILITEEHDSNWPFSEKLKRISDSTIPMKNRFDKIVIPIFISNESELIRSYNEDTFREKFQAEIDNCREILVENFEHDFIKLIDIKVFSFPLKSISELHDKFIEELNND